MTKHQFIFTCLLFAATSIFPTIAFSALTQDPSLDWHTLSTDHFEIHFHTGENKLAFEVAEISEQLPEACAAIEKTCFSCSEAEGFHDELAKHKRQQIIITGIESHICVLQSAIQLQRHGYAVYIVEDAVCSRKKFNDKNAIKRLRQSGVIISNVESVLFEWLRDATHPQFKTLSQLIK